MVCARPCVRVPRVCVLTQGGRTQGCVFLYFMPHERRHGVRHGVLRSDGHIGVQYSLFCPLSFLTGGYHHSALSFICTVHNIFHLHPEEYVEKNFNNPLFVVVAD